MTDPGLPPKPRSLNLLESLVQEEEEKDRNKTVPDVTIPTPGVESSPTSDSQDNCDREKSAGSYKEFKMKDIDNTTGVKSNPNAGFKGKKFSKRRSRSSSSERGKKKGKLVRPFSADYKPEQRNKITSQNSRPKTSKGPHMRKQGSSTRNNSRYERYKSKRSSSSDSYSDDFEDDNLKKDDQRNKRRDDFFDSDSGDNAQTGSKSNYYGSRNEETLDEKNKENINEKKVINENKSNDNKLKEEHRSESESSDEEINAEIRKPANGYLSRKFQRKQKEAKVVYKKRDGQQMTRSDPDSSDYQRMVVVEDYSSSFSSSSEEESTVREEKSSKITKPKNKKLLHRKKTLKNTLVIDPDKYLEAKVHQKYMELEDLMTCSFVDQRRNVTREQVYQMELLRDQYHTVSHGLPSSHVIIPRSLPGDVRSKGSRPLSGHRPRSGRRMQNFDSDQESYDRAYGTLRSVMDAEQARATHAIRTDIIAVRDPPSTVKKKPKKKKTETDTKIKKDHSDEEDISEKPSLKSNTSSENTPRNKGPCIDHHLKYSKNEQLKHWLKKKNKIYRKQIKEERIKKHEERDKLINEANERIERRINSEKQVKKWMNEKNKELRRKHREEKKKEEAERAERKRMEVNLPGDSMKIRPQSAPTSGRPDDVNVDEEKCKGEKTPGYVKDQIHLKREIQEENKQSKLAKQEPHPPQTKFIYKRPVAGKIKFKMQQDRAKSPQGDKSDDGQEKGMRMSYDDWLKRKRRDESTKRKEEDRKRELAKSDPELDRIIPALAKKRVENIMNSRKRVDTGIKHYDEKVNKSFDGADFDGEEKPRPRSAYRLAGEKSEGPALSVKQVRPQTAPTARGRVPHPKKSVKSPRQAVIPQKPDAIMSNSDTSNPYKLPFPPELGVPKYVAERQRKIFADQMQQRLAEAEQEEKVQNEEKDDDKNNLEAVQSRMAEDNAAVKLEDTKQADITELMYSPKKKEETSESSSEDEKNKVKEKDNKEEPEDHSATKQENNASESKDPENAENEDRGDAFLEDNKAVGDNEAEIQSVMEGKQILKSVDIKEAQCSADSKFRAENISNGKYDSSDEQFTKEVTSSEKLNDIGFGPPIIISKDNSDDESDSENENVSMSNSGTTDSERDVESIKTEPNDTKLAENNKEDDSHLVGILKDSKILDNIPGDNVLVPEKVEDTTFTESENKKGDKTDESDDMTGPRDGAAMRKRVSFNEEPTVYQSFESSSTDTITPEQPGELNAEEFGLDAQGSINDDDTPWPEGKEEKTGETLSFNIGGFELNPKVIKSEDDKENEMDKENKDDLDAEVESQSTFITDPDKEVEDW